MSNSDHEKRKATERQLWIALLANDSFQKAKVTATQYMEAKMTNSHPLHHTFVSSLVGTYARFFFDNKKGMGTLPKSYGVFQDPIYKMVHERVLEARHKLYAHNDATFKFYKVEIIFKGFADRYERAMFTETPQFHAANIPPFIEICDLQMERLKTHLNELISLILPEDELRNKLAASPHLVFPVLWPK